MAITALSPALQALDRAAALIGRLEAEVLLCHVLGVGRAAFYAGPSNLDSDRLADFDALVARRLGGEPLQYLTGAQSFRGHPIAVGPGVLVPRPETELLVENAFALIETVADPVVVDVGTGSGAIALSIAVERPTCRVWATEISEAALPWARRNLAGTGVELLPGDLLSPLPSDLAGRIDLIVSNPPYLAEQEWLAAPGDVRDHEPSIALKCSGEGREVTARLIEEAIDWLAPGGWLVVETSPALASEVSRLLTGRYEQVRVVADLAGRPRIARGRKPSQG